MFRISIIGICNKNQCYSYRLLLVRGRYKFILAGDNQTESLQSSQPRVLHSWLHSRLQGEVVMPMELLATCRYVYHQLLDNTPIAVSLTLGNTYFVGLRKQRLRN